MKRSRIGSGSPVVQDTGLFGEGRAAPSRVARLKALLTTDAIFAPVFPETGPVGPFFEEESYVLQVKDQPAVLDWCAQLNAAVTVNALITEWQPTDLGLNGCAGSLVIEEALSAAQGLKQPLQTLSLVDCTALDGGDRNDPDRSEDSADDAGRCIKLLGNIAWQCPEIRLERCFLFCSDELQQWLQKAVESSALRTLTLRAVSGLNDAAMLELAALLLRSGLQSLHLGELDEVGASAGKALANAIAASALTALTVTACDAGFVQALLDTFVDLSRKEPAEQATEPQETLDVKPDVKPDVKLDEKPAERLGQLASLKIELALSQRKDPLHAEPQHDALHEQLDAVRLRFPGLEIVDRIELTDAMDEARITDRHRFLHYLGPHLQLFKRPERVPGEPPSEAPASREPRQRVLPPNAALRVGFYLSEGQGSSLRWVQEIDRHHRQLWKSAYRQEWYEQSMDPARVVQRIQRLLSKRRAVGLFAYARRLRVQQRTPKAPDLDRLAQDCANDAPMFECFNLAFNALRTIERAAEEGRVEDLLRYAALLREHGELPTLAQLEPALDLALDKPALLTALWAFVGEN